MARKAHGGRPASLQRYREKRDFAVTAEPGGKEPGGSTGEEGRGSDAGAAGRTRARPRTRASTRTRRRSPRFVIHEHSARRLHWDLRLERDGVLASWAVPKGLPEEPKQNRFAAATEDHPLEYLDFAGRIPNGQYGAGTITIWDSGTYECLKWEPRKVEVALHGRRLDGRYALFAIDRQDPPKDWMIHRMDPPADRDREPMPARILPMLARSGPLPDDHGQWAYEIKWDGVRAIAYSSPGELRLSSRDLNDVTARYPELGALGRALGSHQAVLDGEIVAFDDAGRPSFEALQRRLGISSPAQAKRLAGSRPVSYMIFDLLWLDGHSLIEHAYLQRRERLAELQLDDAAFRTPEHVVGEGRAVLAASAEQGLEGIVAKRLDSPYQPGRRSSSWVKVKNVNRQELVVGGFLPGAGRRERSIGALLVGFYDEHGRLHYAGRVGSGFSDAELERLRTLLGTLRRPDSPFAGDRAPPRGAVFCEPRLVVEVEFSEWTRAGILRHPTYQGLRDDKPARRVVREPAAGGASERGREAARAHERPQGVLVPEGVAGATVVVQGRELKLTNLDKVLYPSVGFTKRDVIEYYAAIAAVLTAHLDQRPLTVTRWPDGVQGKSFFQKQAPGHRPAWVQTVSVPTSGKPIDYVLADDEATIVWLANLAAVELHAPLARATALERPTAMVFDLDPGPPATALECARVAVALHGTFENLGLQSFAKSSGSKGLQVYVPLNTPEVSFADTKAFARTVAELMAGAEPDLVVARMTKASRVGKVLIDWSQNDRRKTTVCAYSLRASERPTVSTPLDWDEVQTALERRDPARVSFEADQALARVTEHGDLFAPVLSLRQQLPSL